MKRKTGLSLPGIFLAVLILIAGACAKPESVILTPTPRPTASPSPTPDSTSTDFLPQPTVAASATPSPSPTPTEIPPVRFAVIGDYGSASPAEADVASLIHSWQPDFIITLGDNNYPDGAFDTIDAAIGQFFSDYISPYHGEYGAGGEQNRFFPTLGNHDWNTNRAVPYLEYFELPGNERYYDFSWGPLHFFALDSDSREPDGVGASSPQAQWLRERVAAVEAPWKIVYMHHPPYSSGLHGSVAWMRWPFSELGIDAVLAGHDHTYERILRDDIVYFINGLGGGAIYSFILPVEGSQVRFNDDYGAMLVEVTREWITFRFVTRDGELVDEYSLSAE